MLPSLIAARDDVRALYVCLPLTLTGSPAQVDADGELWRRPREPHVTILTEEVLLEQLRAGRGDAEAFAAATQAVAIARRWPLRAGAILGHPIALEKDGRRTVIVSCDVAGLGDLYWRL